MTWLARCVLSVMLLMFVISTVSVCWWMWQASTFHSSSARTSPSSLPLEPVPRAVLSILEKLYLVSPRGSDPVARRPECLSLIAEVVDHPPAHSTRHLGKMKQTLHKDMDIRRWGMIGHLVSAPSSDRERITPRSLLCRI